MFRLTREVRFAINCTPDSQTAAAPTNSFGGYPSLTGLGHYLTLQVCVAGEPAGRNHYLVNIKQIDQAVRRLGIPLVEARIREGRFGGGAVLLAEVFDLLKGAWPGVRLDALALSLSPYLKLHLLSREHPMVRLSQKFEFSASHRLHNPALSDEENRRTFGKCNNPHGHGHNYEVQVTLVGKPDAKGVLIDIPRFEQIVATAVIDRFDHRNLNAEIPEFRELIPSVENIAMTIYRLLKPKFQSESAKLASVTVWETPKTWCEYGEE